MDDGPKAQGPAVPTGGGMEVGRVRAKIDEKKKTWALFIVFPLCSAVNVFLPFMLLFPRGSSGSRKWSDLANSRGFSP